MTFDEARRLLASQPVFWSRLGFCYDPPRAGQDGKQIVFNPDFSGYRRVHDAFSGIGVDLHSSIIHSGWVSDGHWDYDLTDRTLDALLSGAPNRFYIPRIKLNVPPDWCRNHPEDVFVYNGGPRTADEIAALACTPLHDWFGADMTNGYPTNGGSGFTDDRPNIGGLIGLQSFSSKKWVEDARETLRRFIDHLENGPYGKQILAYHVAFGCCGETTLWGSWRPGGLNKRGDYGIGTRRRFVEWAIEKYGSLAAVEKAWNQSGLTPDTLVIPEPFERESRNQSLEGMFYGRPEQAVVPDYNDFLSECTAEALEVFGQTVHETCGKPAGAFYGYLVIPQSAHAGHLAVDRILNSPHIDFLASPRAYDYCVAGEPGGEQAPTQSYNRKKIWMDELDNWTHLDLLKRSLAAKNMYETRTLLWREIAKNLAFDQNFWWMDLGEGWFDSPEIMRELSHLRTLIADLRKTPHTSAAEVLVVTDEQSLRTTAVSYSLNFGLVKRLKRELRLTGAMVDEYRLNDLYDIDLSRYRFVVFLNAFALTTDEWHAIRARLRPDASILWNYAPAVRGGAFSLDRTREVTGFSIAEHPGAHDERCYDVSIAAQDCPAVTILPAPAVKPLLVSQSGAVVLAETARGEGISYLCTEPMLTHDRLRSFLLRAGVTPTAPDGCTVYADNRFAAVCAHDDVTGCVTLPCTARELITGAAFPAGSTETPLPGRGVRFFRYADAD